MSGLSLLWAIYLCICSDFILQFVLGASHIFATKISASVHGSHPKIIHHKQRFIDTVGFNMTLCDEFRFWSVWQCVNYIIHAMKLLTLWCLTETTAEIFLSAQSRDKSTVLCRGHLLTDCRLLQPKQMKYRIYPNCLPLIHWKLLTTVGSNRYGKVICRVCFSVWYSLQVKKFK